MKLEQYKIIALDVDGTLVNNQGLINEADKTSLIRVQKELGIRLIIATGRPYAGMKHLGFELKLEQYDGFLLPYNGGEAYKANGQRLWQETFPVEYIPALYELVKLRGLNILTYTETHILSENISDSYLAKEVGITGMPTREVSNFVKDIPQDIPKCLVVGSPKEVEKLEKEVHDLFGNSFEAFRSDPTFLELVPQNINKALSIDRLLKLEDLASDNLIAFGDSYNDLEMLKFAHLGIAMGNACDDVKAVANIVTLSNEESGISSMINRMFFE